MSNNTIVDFAAEFGGRDAASRVLPHFRALKRAAKKVQLPDFPFPELVFILRVDGEISQYGNSGIDNFDFDKAGEYLSLDIVMTLQNQEKVIEFISSSLINSSEEITKEMSCRKIGLIDADNIKNCMNELIANYVEEMTQEKELSNGS